MSKKKNLFFFSLATLFFTMYLSQFSLTPSIFLFSFTCSHSCSSLRLHCPHSHLLGLLLFSRPQMPKWPFPFISFTFSFLFFLPHSSHQITTNASNLTLTLLQPKSLSPALIGRMAFACFFSFFFSVSNTLWLTFC